IWTFPRHTPISPHQTDLHPRKATPNRPAGTAVRTHQFSGIAWLRCGGAEFFWLHQRPLLLAQSRQERAARKREDNEMSWKSGVEELTRRQRMTAEMGGEDKLARQRAAGKLNARERIASLLDEGSFREIGSVSGKAEYDDSGNLIQLTAANFIFGRGR